jgi:KDO2-lipid IV(A) lauroyltransferase
MGTKHKIEYLLFYFFVSLFKIIGLEKTRRLASVLARVLFYLIRVRRNVVISNISKAFPEKKADEIRKIAFENYRNTLITFFEMMVCSSLSNNEVLEQMEHESFIKLNEEIANHKSLLLVTAHLGGWEFSIVSLPLIIKRIFNVLVREQSNPGVTEWLRKSRSSSGCNIIPANISIRHLYEALKREEIVIIAGDQRGDAHGQRFSFFNTSTALYTGLATISVKTNSPIVAYCFVRLPDNKYKVDFKRIDLASDIKEKETRINKITQNYISFVESVVIQNPEQYFWMHKLWKH